jgi:hypothetical protein
MQEEQRSLLVFRQPCPLFVAFQKPSLLPSTNCSRLFDGCFLHQSSDGGYDMNG